MFCWHCGDAGLSTPLNSVCVCVCSDEEDKQTSFCFDFVKRLLGLNKYDVIQESRLIFVDKEMGAGNEAQKPQLQSSF